MTEEWDVRGRAAGKTHELVRWLLDGHESLAPARTVRWSRVIVAPSVEQADYIRDRYDLDYDVVFPMRGILDGRLAGRGDVEVGIDEAGLLLARLFPGHRIGRVNASGLLVPPGPQPPPLPEPKRGVLPYRRG